MRKKQNPAFSIIIPTLNEQDHIGELLSDVFASSIIPKEVFVIDAGSSDGTENEVKQFDDITYIVAHPPVGFQRTLGGEKATGEILFFLDADVRIEPRFFEEVVNDMQRKSLDICCVRMVPYQSSFVIRCIYAVFHLAFVLFQKFLASGAGSCIVVKKQIFDQLGGFDSTLTYDDIEFIRRASVVSRFATLQRKIFVSDRRFRKYGVIATTAQYILLSVFFCFGLFKLANVVKYSFGQYHKK